MRVECQNALIVSNCLNEVTPGGVVNVPLSPVQSWVNNDLFFYYKTVDIPIIKFKFNVGSY